jgi:hypothetical protein
MLVETTIKPGRKGLTISQQFSQNGAGTAVPVAQGNSLSATHEQSLAAHAAQKFNTEPGAAGAPADNPGPATGPLGVLGSTPITVIGPIFFGWPPPSDNEDNGPGAPKE